jgi:hypothetical protein
LFLWVLVFIFHNPVYLTFIFLIMKGKEHVAETHSSKV